MKSAAEVSGSARMWGRLWGARADDWAANEERQLPTYEEAIREVGIEGGERVLDIGCGTGVFLRLAADQGAAVWGIDAAEALIELAAARVPEASLRVGEMQSLPYEDDTFDVVNGFNSFFFAQDMVASLREAGRVAKPGGRVVIQVWGPPERNDLEAMKEIARELMPAPSPDAPKPPPLWRPGVLEALAEEAGLQPERAFDLRYAFEYVDSETLGRLMLAPAGIGEIAGPDREADVRRQITEALASRRQADGSYRLDNDFHFLVATAR